MGNIKSGGVILDNNERNRNTERDNEFNLGEMLLRVVITSIVLAVAAFFTPGFTIDGLWSVIMAAVVIGVIDYLIQRFTGIDASPFGRGFAGFILTAVILYITQFVVRGFNISFWGAIIGALVIGIIDAIMPGRDSV